MTWMAAMLLLLLLLAGARTTTTAAAAYSPDFSGITINLLTEQDTLIHNPAYWTAAFANRTGAKVQLVGMRQSDLHPEMMAAVRDRVNYYDLFIYQGQRIVDYVACDTCDSGFRTLFEDLTDWVPQQPDLVWPDIAYYIRSYIGQYNGKIYGIPLDGDVFFLYTNTELLGRYTNATGPPRTWDEFNAVAAQVRDGLERDRVNDTWATCLPKSSHGVWPWHTFMFMAPYLQSLGTQQGLFFDPDTFEPLLDNDGVREALRQMRRTNEYGPPHQFALTVAGVRDLFKRGKCAMTVDWGDIILLANKSDAVRGKVRVSPTPGSTTVWDRDARRLRACTDAPSLCPYAVDGINYASLAASGGWVAAVNHYSTGLRKQAALEFLKLIGSQRASNLDVTRGFGFDMCRVGQMRAEFWTGNGFTPSQAEATVGAVGSALNGPNTVSDLRIPRNFDYEHGAVDGPVYAFLAGNRTADDLIAGMVADWARITDAAGGRAAQLDVYRRTLALPPRTRFDCARCDPVGGRCVADGQCVCRDGWDGPGCAAPVAVQALAAGDPVAGVVLAVAALGAVSTLALVAFLVRYGGERVVKAKSPVLMRFVGAGLLCGYASVVCSIGRPTAASCALEPVLLALCSALVVGVLVAKTYRIKKIFRNPTLVVVAMRNGQVLRLAAVLALPNLALAALLVTVRAPDPVVRVVGLDRFWTCQSDDPVQIVLKSLLLAYNFLVLAIGVVLAFQTRQVISEFNESKSIGDAVYVITFGMAVVFPLSFARLDLVVLTSIRLLITVASLFLVQLLLMGKLLFQFVLARSQSSRFAPVDTSKGGVGVPVTAGSRSRRIVTLTGTDLVASARIDGQMFAVPVMRGGWMASWASATIVFVPARDLCAIVTDDGTGHTYKLSAMAIVKAPASAPPSSPTAPAAAESNGKAAAGGDDDDDVEQRMFEISFGADRYRIDTLGTSIWSVVQAFASTAAGGGVTTSVVGASKMRESEIGKNSA